METCNPTRLNAHSDLAGYFSRYCSGPVCFGAACTNKSSRKQEPTAIPQQRADSKHYCYCLFAKRNCAFFFFFLFKAELGRVPRGTSPYMWRRFTIASSFSSHSHTHTHPVASVSGDLSAAGGRLLLCFRNKRQFLQI